MVISGRNVKYASSLRQKFSSKVIRQTERLLSNGSIGLVSAEGVVDLYGQCRASLHKINLFVEALGKKLLLFEKALAIGIRLCGEYSSLFKRGSMMSG